MDLSIWNTGGTDCSRARESISASLDGELHELDSHRLHTHLRICADCAAWLERVEATTSLVREAPLLAVPAAIELPPRRRTWRTAPGFAAASALALAASVLVALGGATHGAFAPRPGASTQRRDVDQNGPAVGVYAPDAQHRAFHAV